jgi:2-polyprenyl-3-methyl-5-hydroxy-6-metoxy-1,4-benzoquinol methylase
MASSQKTIDDFNELHQRHALVHVVRAAVDLGIFGVLSSGQQTAEQLAERLHLKLSPLKRLMNVLVQTELIEQYGDDYALSTLARLIPESQLDFGDQFWQKLAEHIRTEKEEPVPLSPPTARLSGKQEENYLHQKWSEEWLLTPIAMDAIEILDIGRSRRGLRVLEIGASSAVFSATLAHRDPDSVINLLDTRAGLARSRLTISSIGLERQSEWIEVDCLTELEKTAALKDQLFDLVILAGVIHRFSVEDCQRLLKQTWELLKPGRELAIVDVFPGQSKGDRARAIFELELGLRIQSGRLYQPSELKQMLQDSGFENLQYAHLPSAPHYWGLLLAQKRD